MDPRGDSPRMLLLPSKRAPRDNEREREKLGRTVSSSPRATFRIIARSEREESRRSPTMSRGLVGIFFSFFFSEVSCFLGSNCRGISLILLAGRFLVKCLRLRGRSRDARRASYVLGRFSKSCYRFCAISIIDRCVRACSREYRE